MSIPKATVRLIIFHVPGRAWDRSVEPASQAGVMDHVSYLQKLKGDGLIEYSGPFLKEGAGGMILTASGVTAEQAQAMGDHDPAVKSGLITFEVREWMITIGGTPQADA